jgi:hypothetical protein
LVIHNEAKYRCTIHRFKLNLIERTKFTRHRHHMLQVYVSCVKNFMSVLDLMLLSIGKHIYLISCIGSLLYDTIYALRYASILSACVYYYNVHIRASLLGPKWAYFHVNDNLEKNPSIDEFQVHIHEFTVIKCRG